MPILEYCCWNWFYNPFQPKLYRPSMMLYHNLASILLMLDRNAGLWHLLGKHGCPSMSLVLRRCASTSLSGMPVNSGLKMWLIQLWHRSWLNWLCGWTYWSCRRYYGLGAGGADNCTGGADGENMKVAEVQVVWHLPCFNYIVWITQLVNLILILTLT